MAYANPTEGVGEPIIEVDGTLRFSLPGQPLFPALADDTILKPTLARETDSTTAAKLDAELAHLTGGKTWAADYSVVAPEQGDTVDLTGLVTTFFSNPLPGTASSTYFGWVCGSDGSPAEYLYQDVTANGLGNNSIQPNTSTN